MKGAQEDGLMYFPSIGELDCELPASRHANEIFDLQLKWIQGPRTEEASENIGDVKAVALDLHHEATR